MKIAFSAVVERDAATKRRPVISQIASGMAVTSLSGRIRDIDGREAPGKFRAFVANRPYHRRARRQRTETEHACSRVRERSRDRLIDNVSEVAFSVPCIVYAACRCAGCAFNGRFFDKFGNRRTGSRAMKRR